MVPGGAGACVLWPEPGARPCPTREREVGDASCDGALGQFYRTRP